VPPAWIYAGTQHVYGYFAFDTSFLLMLLIGTNLLNFNFFCDFLRKTQARFLCGSGLAIPHILNGESSWR
jgi:hypothetical protein